MTTSGVTGAGSYNNLLNNSLVTGSTSTAATAAGTATLGSTQDLAQTFLSLLVAQMNNQDPLNPVDNNELTTQMAQISTVTGINTLNTTVAGLVNQLQQSANLQTAQLSGHSVMVAGSGINLATNSTATSGVSGVGAYSLTGAAQNVTVTISNSSGTVRTLQLGPQQAGMQNFTWDGTTDAGTTAAAGSYSFTVSASAGSSTVTPNTYTLQPVIGTVPQANGGMQILLGNGTQVPYSAIAEII